MGTITGLLALGKASTAKTECPNVNDCSTAGTDAVDSGRTLGTISTIGFIVGGVGAAVGVYGLVWGKPESSASVAVSVGPDGRRPARDVLMGIRRSHRVMAALAIASVASVALGACNLLTGLDADYSANAHDGAVAPVGEGGGGDGPGSDGQGGDGSTTDGMVKADAGDGGGVVSYCEGRRGASDPADFFCTDFDTESFPGNGTAPTPWLSLTNNLDAGTFAFVPDAGDGGSRVLDVTGVSTAASGAHTFLKAALSAPKAANTYQGYALEFEFRVLVSNLDYDALGLLVFKPNTQVGENGIAGYGPGTPHLLSHQGTGASPVKKVPNSIPTDWHLAKITLTRVDAGPTYMRTIKIDSTDVDDSTGAHTIDIGAPTELWIGVFNAATTLLGPPTRSSTTSSSGERREPPNPLPPLRLPRRHARRRERGRPRVLVEQRPGCSDELRGLDVTARRATRRRRLPRRHRRGCVHRAVLPGHRRGSGRSSATTSSRSPLRHTASTIASSTRTPAR